MEILTWPCPISAVIPVLLEGAGVGGPVYGLTAQGNTGTFTSAHVLRKTIIQIHS